jgi:hypothetical protein
MNQLGLPRRVTQLSFSGVLGRLSNDRVLQTLQQERSDLKRQLEEKEDLVSVALERQKKAEAFANELVLFSSPFYWSTLI